MEQTMSLPASWSRGSLIAFRFFFAYFIFYIFPFPLNFLPKISALFQPLTDLSAAICGYIAKNFIGVEHEIYGRLMAVAIQPLIMCSFSYSWRIP